MTTETQVHSIVPANGSGAMFDRLAKRYDLLNRLISMGGDRSWRRRTVRELAVGSGASKILDLATGTGDLALNIVRMYPRASVVGLDPSKEMLAVGQKKIDRHKLSDRIELVKGVAEELPFADDSFDGVSIAFGIRNCTDRRKSIREMKRVTKPGGRVVILELGEPKGGAMASLARFHIHHVIPRIGSWLSGAKEYRYLQTSIAAFPPAHEFALQMAECGLAMQDIITFAFGSCHLYIATVPGSYSEK